MQSASEETVHEQPTYMVTVPESDIVNCKLGGSIYKYLLRVFDLGAVEGPLGKMDINPILIEAFHHVLAGGEVEIKLARRSDPDVVEELNDRLRQGCKETNEINKASGYLAVWF